MISNTLVPSRQEAAQILEWGHEQNPGQWTDHCRAVARAAEAIAGSGGLDKDIAYALGLMHDIGYYSYRDGKGETCHIYAGYELMKNKGYDYAARICLTHSFPYKDINGYGNPRDMTCSDEEISTITNFLSETVYDDYDKLIQLCDCIATAQGICIMEKRMLSVIMRHGFSDFTNKRLVLFFELKNYFDKKCSTNIYNLFYDEIKADIFE